MITLRDLVEREGYSLEEDPGAADRADAKGTPQRDELCAQACEGNVIAIRPTVPEGLRYYPISHEIAEDRCGHTGHHQGMWREQLNVMARWLRIVMDDNRRLSLELGKRQ